MAKKKMIKACIALILITSLCGCASAMLTEGSRLYSKLENGEKSTGGFVRYKYSGSLRENVGHLSKTPMCSVLTEKLRVAKKEPRGMIFIVPEIVFFGLGFYDQMRVHGIIEESKKVEPLAKFESGEVACGEKQPAANEEIVIFVRPEAKDGVAPKPYYKTASTNEYGFIDFNKIFAGETRILNLTARLASDESEAVSFQYIPLNHR